MKTITVFSPKGGTGKTVTAAALLQAASEDGKKALAVDLDPQSNLSFWTGADTTRAGSYALIEGLEDASDCIQPAEVDTIAGSAELSGLKTGKASARRLEAALDLVSYDYDIAVIDTAPGLGEGMNNALFAADWVLIPLQTDSNSLQALYQAGDILQQVQAGKPSVQLLGAVITAFDGRAKINRYFLDVLQQTAAGLSIPFLGTVRAGIAIREANALGKSIFKYAPKSRPAEDYWKLYQQIKGAIDP